ncbi:hypothetical protein ARSEF4850_008622 [Beauveria asiatica]
MTEMAVSPVDNGQPDAKPAKNRQFSLYANRIKPIDVRGPVEPPPLPQVAPVLPRWDSLENGPHLMAVSPTADSFPKDVFYDAPEQLRPPLSPAFEEFPRIPFEEPLPSPKPILSAKSSNADMRQSSGSVGNFSRPRKPSIKLPLQQKPATPKEPSPQLNHSFVGSPWHNPRPRAQSNASVTSTYTFASPPLANVYDWSAPPSPRLCTAPHSTNGSPITAPTSTSSRPPFATYNRVDSSVSAPPGPVGGSSGAPWAGGDEMRSSFRSQLTTSTAPGTTVTERSSVMTKDSSVSSLYANADAEADEFSIEDVMLMYENGFKDDTDNEDDATDSEGLPRISRQLTTLSETGPAVARFEQAESSQPPRVAARAAPTALDAEIRQSKMLFSSPAFTSMLPAIAGDNMTIKEEEPPHKRDSAKSIGTDPSVTSRPATSELKETLPVSPISDTFSQPNSISPTPPPAPVPSYAETEEPGSRDRYGFKKQSQSITRQQYDDWNKNYSQYLSRRRRKWVAYLKDHALLTDRPIRFPPPNAKTKRFVRKGIPPDWRGAAWFYYAGGPAILSKHSGLYEKLLCAHAKQIDIDAIERDLHRTFPDNIQFKPSPAGFDASASASSSERQSQSTLTSNETSSECSAQAVPGEPPIITSLRRVLHAFSIYNPRIGYCQSLNFLAGLLLLFVETEEQCFWLLNVITHVYLPGTHEMSLEGSKVDLGVLMTEIRDTMPEVWDRIGGELEEQTNFKPPPSRLFRRPLGRSRHRGHPSLSTERLPPITLCMTAWFMSCFIGTLPIETTLRVWDVFFYEGSKTLFRVALAIFKHGEAEIKSISDPMEMFGVVQALPRKMLDANLLMEQSFKKRNGFNHLNQDAIDDKRRERRDKARKDREQIQHSQTMQNGNVTETETVSVVRRATLFGKKRHAKPEI